MKPARISKLSLVSVLMVIAAMAAGILLPCLCALPARAATNPDPHAGCTQRPGLHAADSCCCSGGANDRATAAWTSVAPVSLASPQSAVCLEPADPFVAPQATILPLRPVGALPPLRI